MSRWRRYQPAPTTRPSLSEGVTLEEWRRWQATADRSLTDPVIQHHARPVVIEGKGTFSTTQPKTNHS